MLLDHFLLLVDLLVDFPVDFPVHYHLVRVFLVLFSKKVADFQPISPLIFDMRLGEIRRGTDSISPIQQPHFETILIGREECIQPRPILQIDQLRQNDCI